MTAFLARAAGQTQQGLRAYNEDRYAIDADRPVLVVADGMGGDGTGARAASLAVELLPRQIAAGLEDSGQAGSAIERALREADRAVVALSEGVGADRRCGASVVVAFRHSGEMFVTWLGDCAAYHVSGDATQQLTVVHDVRNAVIRAGTMTEEEARHSAWRNVLYRYLGCAEMIGPDECRSFRPQPGDRLILATDGLWRLVEEGDLQAACRQHPEPQACADHLVALALDRGSRDNVTCVVAAFAPVCIDPAWLAWNGGTVARIARSVNEERAFDRLPVLADALEDAGCDNADILGHCRSGGPHVRGCWALDAVLGKE
jgi:protein phosphatase